MPDTSDATLRQRLQQTLSGTHILEHELGGGGMSRVFVAEETRLHRKVVIKVLSPELAQGISVERFEREIQLAASLQQANIVPVLTAGETDGLPFYAMPFVDGESLRARLAGGPLPIPEVVSILRDICRALGYAHRRGIVHRDIKPDNVLLSSGAAVVTDFGIAKAISAARTHGGSTALTQTGSAIGTPAYMAPEQAAGDQSIDQRSDIYAVGCLAYELLTGAPPFTGPTAQRVIAAQIADAPVPVGERRRDTPRPLADAVMRALAKDPAHRPASAEDLAASLDSTTRSGRSRVRLSGARRWAMIGIAVVIVAGGASLIAHRIGEGRAGTITDRSLAVLPITNASGDSAREYLADGMTTELAGNLRQTPGLTVVGDLSTFRFKHSALTPAAIAGQLKVAMLLSGTLQMSGNRVRLQMQLNDAAGKLLWSDRFDREMNDNFALQDDVTAAVAREMQLVLTPATTQVTRGGRTENPQAHDLYMRAMFEKSKLSESALDRSVALFRQAIAADSGYARAWAGLAFAYDMLADAYRPSHQYHLLARDAAGEALTRDSTLADARVTYGFESAAANWDFDGGLAEMRRGIALDPNSPDALFMYAAFLSIDGKPDEAVRNADWLIHLDPLSASARLLKATVLALGRRWRETLAADSDTKRVDPATLYFDALDGAALRELGHLPESVAAYQTFEAITGVPASGLALTYGLMGKTADARRIADSLVTLHRQRWVDPTFIAAAYLGAGDRDRAMQWVDTAYADRSYTLRFDGAYWLDPIRDDPRFKVIWARMLGDAHPASQ